MRELALVVALLCLSGATWADIITIDGGSYTGCYTNSGNEVIITDGLFSNNQQASVIAPFVNDSGRVTVSGGSFSGIAYDHAYGLSNSGTANISGGSFAGTASTQGGYGLLNRGAVAISAGSFTGMASSYGYGLANDKTGNVTITGGSFTGNASARDCFGLFNYYGKITITGGDFRTSACSYSYGLYNTGGMVVITGGRFGSTAYDNSYGLYNAHGTIKVYGTFAQYGMLPWAKGHSQGRLPTAHIRQ